MKVTKISVSRGATVNIGSYESARVDLGIEAEDTTFEEVDALVKAALAEAVEAIQEEASLPPNPAGRFTG